MVKLIVDTVLNTLFKFFVYIDGFFLLILTVLVYHILIIAKVDGIFRLVQAFVILVATLTVSFARNFGF